jgi:hypothetical protein
MRKTIYQPGKKVLAFLIKTFIFVAPFKTIATDPFPQDKTERSAKQNGFHSSTWLYPHSVLISIIQFSSAFSPVFSIL